MSYFRYLFFLLLVLLIQHTSYSQYKGNLNIKKKKIVANIIKELNLAENSVYYNHVKIKKLKLNSNEFLVLLPVIVSGEKDENSNGYYSFDKYILVYNINKEKIVNKSINLYKSKNKEGSVWMIDACKFNLRIDTAPYILNDSIRAFGIVRTTSCGKLGIMGYFEDLNLYIKQDNKLKLILDNFHVVDGVPYPQKEPITKQILIISKTKTNGFYDILVKKTHKFYDDDLNIIKSYTTKYTLKYDGNKYKKSH